MRKSLVLIAVLAAAIAAWDKVLALNFVQTDDATNPGQIRVAMTDVDTLAGKNVWGYAYAPPAGGAAPGRPPARSCWRRRISPARPR